MTWLKAVEALSFHHQALAGFLIQARGSRASLSCGGGEVCLSYLGGCSSSGRGSFAVGSSTSVIHARANLFHVLNVSGCLVAVVSELPERFSVIIVGRHCQFLHAECELVIQVIFLSLFHHSCFHGQIQELREEVMPLCARPHIQGVILLLSHSLVVGVSEDIL